MRKRLLFHWVAVLGVALAVSAASNLLACGVSWLVPKDHFDGVNEYGYVSCWEQIGELDLKDGYKIPLVIGFESNREASSPYLGKGWILPLLDSRIVQTSERDFQMIMPDGYSQSFWRDKTPELLTGQLGWKAEIKGDTITAYASCGWRLVFTKGRLAAVTTPKNRTFDYVFNGGRVVEIRERGATVLRVDVDAATGAISGLSYGDRLIGIEFAAKPQVQSIKGQNMVVGMQQSLRKMTLPGGSTRSYEFAVDDRIRPTLIISGSLPRTITWDPATKRIVKDGLWTYDIKPSEVAFENAAIGRTNDKGEREYWFLESSKGRETIKGTEKRSKVGESSGGETRVVTSFMSGVLKNKIRREEFLHGESKIREVVYSYDEAGNQIRKTDSQGGISEFAYRTDRGLKIVTESQNGFPVSLSVFDAVGNLRATSVVMANPEKQEKHLESILNKVNNTK